MERCNVCGQTSAIDGMWHYVDDVTVCPNCWDADRNEFWWITIDFDANGPYNWLYDRLALAMEGQTRNDFVAYLRSQGWHNAYVNGYGNPEIDGLTADELRELILDTNDAYCWWRAVCNCLRLEPCEDINYLEEWLVYMDENIRLAVNQHE